MPTEALVRARLEWIDFHRRLSLVPRREMPAKIYHAISRRVWPWYYRSRRLSFRLRNFCTGNRPIAVRLGEVSFYIAPAGAVAFDYWSGLRVERHEISFILRWLRPGMMFLDIGANLGLFSLAVAAKLQDRPGEIYAFEPCEETSMLLEANLRLNSFQRVHAVRLALADYQGEGTLHVNAGFKDGLNTLGQPSHADSEVVGQQSVSVTTLDSFLAARGMERVNLMKVDVEGAERLVFRGARNLLSRPDAPLILYEGYSWCTAGFGYHPVEIMWLLEEFGYELFVLDSRTGRARRRTPGEGYDAMMVAIKPSDSRYVEMRDNGELI